MLIKNKRKTIAESVAQTLDKYELKIAMRKELKQKGEL